MKVHCRRRLQTTDLCTYILYTVSSYRTTLYHIEEEDRLGVAVFSYLTWTIFSIPQNGPFSYSGRFYLVDHVIVDVYFLPVWTFFPWTFFPCTLFPMFLYIIAKFHKNIPSLLRLVYQS